MKRKTQTENQNGRIPGFEEKIYEQERDRDQEISERQAASEAFLLEEESLSDGPDFWKSGAGKATGPRMLPVVKLKGKKYFIDERLKQLCNVADPADFIDF